MTGLNRGEVGGKVFVGDVELSSSKGAALAKSQPITECGSWEQGFSESIPNRESVPACVYATASSGRRFQQSFILNYEMESSRSEKFMNCKLHVILGSTKVRAIPS